MAMSIAHLMLDVLTFVASVVLLIYSLYYSWKRTTNVRQILTFHNAAIALFPVFCVFDGVGVFTPGAVIGAGFTINLIEIIILVTLARLIDRIITIQHQGKSKVFIMTISYCNAALLFILSIAVLAVWVWNLQKHGAKDGMHYSALISIIVSYYAVASITGIFLIYQSFLMAIKTRSEEQLSQVSRLSLVCCGLWLLSNLYKVIITVITHSPRFLIGDIFLSIWPKLVLLCIVVVINLKELDGLWNFPMSIQARNTPVGYSGTPTERVSDV